MMLEDRLKKRIARAKKKTMTSFEQAGYGIIPSDNSIFCFFAVRQNEIKMVKVVIDKISDEDIRIVEEMKLPSNCPKEIWCKRRKSRQFDIMQIMDDNQKNHA